jgi:hypothetical protein
MNLQDQVCTLKQAKTLDHLGIIPGPTAFSWRFDEGMKWRIDPDGYFDPEADGVELYPALTAAELGKANGETITINTAQWDAPAAALADHLIGRLERNEVTVGEINSSLQS